MSVLSVRGLTKSFGAVTASRDVTLDLEAGTIHALIGPNGAGKSTLIKQISGGLRPDAGTVHLDGRDVTRLTTAQRARAGLGRSFQVSAIVPEFTVCQNVMLALIGRERLGFRALRRWRAEHALVAEAEAHAGRTHLDGRMEVEAASLAHGERRRLEIAMALALRPRAFLFDEPMAGLGAEGAAEITALLTQLKHEAPILLVEHDMDAVFALADRISVLVYGEVIATGTVEEVRADPAVRAAYLGEEEAT
jgi:branched-chain amino acid transport system ATP-binding protein